MARAVREVQAIVAEAEALVAPLVDRGVGQAATGPTREQTRAGRRRSAT